MIMMRGLQLMVSIKLKHRIVVGSTVEDAGMYINNVQLHPSA